VSGKRIPQLSLAANTKREPLVAPPDRGVLWYDFQIPDRFFAGLPSIGQKVRWVRTHLPRASRIKIGQMSAWYELDIMEYLESERGHVPAEPISA
jgi:hypothetical protein